MSDGDRPGEPEIEARMRELLARLRPGRTICPSDVARSLSSDWRPLMEPTRTVARRLVEAGDVEITQGGQVVDPGSARGPIRIRPVQRSG
jgi:hypothetical protein